MLIQKIQAVTTTVTMIGVWSNLYLNYYKMKQDKNK